MLVAVLQLFRPLNMYVALVGVEVWTNEDKSDVVGEADKTMNNFLEYRRKSISPYHPNDNAQLIMWVQALVHQSQPPQWQCTAGTNKH